MSTNTQQNPIWEIILKNCGADAINVVDAYYTKVTRDVGDSLDKLRQNTVASITASIKASFAIASAVLLTSLVEASSQLAGAYGSMSSLNEMSSAEKEVQPYQTKASRLEKEEKELNEQLKGDPNNQTLKDNLAKKTAEKNANKTLLDKKNKNMDLKTQQANTKSNMILYAAQGAATIPKAYSDAIRTKGDAITAVLNQLVNMLSSTYDKSNQTLRSFFDLDYLGGLVSLGQIQLR